MMRRLLAAAAVALVAGCTSVPQVPPDLVRQAETVAYTADGSYVASLRVATAWAKQPRCGTPRALPPPGCSTAKGVIDAEARRIVARREIDRLKVLTSDVRATPDAISASIAATRAAVGAYEAIAGGGQ